MLVEALAVGGRVLVHELADDASLLIEPLMLELRHFTDCVRENRPSQVPGSAGLHALQLAEAVASEVARGMN